MALQLPSGISPSTAAAINSVSAAYDTENLRAALMSYPARIKAQRDVVQQARKELKDAELDRATAEAGMLITISAETNEAGKTKFTNVEARAAELLRRKGSDPEYGDLAAQVSDAESELLEAQDTLQMLLDEYQSARIAARLIAAEMSVLSELIDVGEAEEVSGDAAMAAEVTKFGQKFDGRKSRVREAL